MTTFKELPEEVTKLWIKWEIRAMVLLSLSLQIFLIIFGSRRKYISGIWVSFLVWSAYLSADTVASFALGNIATSQRYLEDSCSLQPQKPTDALLVFWAPFLLLHLGGPDTITSYALEDNELWLRHLLNLVIQAGVTLYIFISSWSRTSFTLLAIPIFVAGVIKYGERTSVLRSSSIKNKRDSLRSTQTVPPSLRSRKKKIVPRESYPPEGNYLQEASYLFKMSKYLFFDLILGSTELEDSFSVVRYKSAEEAFQLVEVELGFMYDELYTKVPSAFSLSGIIHRSTCFLSYIASLVAFEIKVDKESWSRVDIGITYLLLGGACLVEVYSIFVLAFSDRMMVLLTRSGNSTTNPMTDFINFLQKHLVDGKRWSGSMGQYNLISSCHKINPSEFLKKMGIDYLIKYRCIHQVDIKLDLKHVIFEQLLRKGRNIMEPGSYTELRNEQLAARGEAAIRSWNRSDSFLLSTTQEEFDYSLLVWHIATDLLSGYDGNDAQSNANDSSTKRQICKWLSDYMLYLLVVKPDMLPKGIGDIGHRYRNTCLEVTRIFNSKVVGYPPAGEELLLRLPEYIITPLALKAGTSVLLDGWQVARRLKELGHEEKWEVMQQVWIEMLAFAACHCPWKEHAQQLRSGGEMLTHVCLLMAHLGLNRQYRERFTPIMAIPR